MLHLEELYHYAIDGASLGITNGTEVCESPPWHVCEVGVEPHSWAWETWRTEGLLLGEQKRFGLYGESRKKMEKEAEHENG